MTAYHKYKKGLLMATLFSLLLLQAGFSAIRLPALVADRMVLQRNTELKIWGWADVDEKVTLRFLGKSYYTQAGEDGQWAVNLPPLQPGGPFLMEINEIVIRDILVGDVWLCSGQSNMETPIDRLVERYPEINESNNHMIRYYKVPTQNTPNLLQEDIKSGAQWYSGTASDVMNWTALAYFYAHEAYNHTQVPVGMLVSSLGGSPIESWISQEHLREFPAFLLDRSDLENSATKEDWPRRDIDDSDWGDFKVPGEWMSQGIKTGRVVYFRRVFAVPKIMVGRHAKLYMGTMIDSDSVFVNDHFVGSTPYMYPPRKYDIPAGVLTEGENTITVKLRADAGNGAFIEDKVYKITESDFEIDLSGDWKYKIGQTMSTRRGERSGSNQNRSVGSGLYNGMIYPLRDYAFAGVIWYQGESNTGQKSYATHLTSLVDNWRQLLDNPNLPFLLVQLPNFLKKQDQPSASGWAMVREAQFQTAITTPQTALAVTYDTGEWNDIHPLNKKDIASRLFLGARKLVYGEKLVSSGPLYKEMRVDGDQIVVSFTEIGGGLAVRDGQELKHFAIAGKDQKYVWADAVIKGNSVVVKNKQVSEPVAVRYAWSDNPEEANLINKEGLLASPFRTDNW